MKNLSMEPIRQPKQQEMQRVEQKSPTLADQRKQSTPTPKPQPADSTTPANAINHEKIKLKEINPYLTCHLCKGYLIDATTISECLHSFCRSCIIKFLEDEEHSYCPVCEVIINKAKPNLKLDKTLQDIVYKLVPGLFLAEMLRRKRFYAERPGETGGVSPEQRGEDTERTIFNPQDRISLSLEYIGDAETSGLILKDLKNALLMEQQKNVSQTASFEAETLLKRYLQCPGMCRIDVIKKFIRNKYNVNTDLFQIDILYKRVPLPLPDHYTLIDVAYIYTWKRNEPMRFYFRIIEKSNADELPDLTKVFTPIEPLPPPKTPSLLRPNVHCSTPARKISMKTSTPTLTPPPPANVVTSSNVAKKRTPKKRKSPTKPTANLQQPVPTTKLITNNKTRVDSDKTVDEYDFDKNCDNEQMSDFVKFESVQKKKESNKISVCGGSEKVYTNITLNRTNNSEIITTKSANFKELTNNNNNLKNSVGNEPPKPLNDEENAKLSPKNNSTNANVNLSAKELELKKNEFFKSIELTSKKTVANLAKLMMLKQKEQQQIKTVVEPKTSPTAPKINVNNFVLPQKNCGGDGSSGGAAINANNVKQRKNSSPKKQNVSPSATPAPSVSKKTTKIIIQPKPGYSARLIPHNNNGEQKHSELQNLFQNCRLNIPSSLSITLKENGEINRKPNSIPPVQNYIEILKIDEKAQTQSQTQVAEQNSAESEKNTLKNVENSAKNCAVETVEPTKVEEEQKCINSEETSKNNNAKSSDSKLQSFQKIFEDSIINKSTNNSNNSETENQVKRKNPSELMPAPKKPKLEKEEKTRAEDVKSSPQKQPQPPRCGTPFPDAVKLTIPRVAKNTESTTHQTVANLHSSCLGLNYTVSVGKPPKDVVNTGVQTKTDNNIAPQKHPPTTTASSPKKGVKIANEADINNSGVKIETEMTKKEKSVENPETKTPQKIKNEVEEKEPVATIRSSPAKMSFPLKKLSPKSPTTAPANANGNGCSSASQLTSNQLLEKYNIQNLAQLSASVNFNAAMASQNFHQMAALQQAQAMLMKQQFEMQNRKWLNINQINQGPLLQFEKYLQTLNGAKNQILGKDN